MNAKRVILKPGKDKPLLRNHPWIFSGAVSKTVGNPADGDFVEVYDCENSFLAAGHYQPGSIVVRIIKYSPGIPDEEYWTKMLENAAARRKEIIDVSETNVFRLVHGEGDYLPGLIVDVYNDVAVVQAHSAGMFRSVSEIAKALAELKFPQIKAVYNKSRNTYTGAAGSDSADGFVSGESSPEIIVKENGLLFHVNIAEGQKTGFFIDQRVHRQLLRYYAKGKSVCNLFSYTGGFSVYAMAGGATEVVSVDSSKSALEMAGRNAELNGFTTHSTLQMDISKDFGKSDRKYDIVIVDPPAYAKQLSQRNNAMKAYARLNADVMTKITHGGIIFTFSCSQAVSFEDFRSAIFSASLTAGKKVRILQRLTQPPDHAVSIFHPEGEYLKGLVLMVE
jgi:23S rRNA (cytosine1962-C5)-methyltransferase